MTVRSLISLPYMPFYLHLDILHTFTVFSQKNSSNDLAVDVGCGSGQGTLLLAPHFTRVVGTDISPAQLEMARKHVNIPNVSYRYCRQTACLCVNKSAVTFTFPSTRQYTIINTTLCFADTFSILSFYYKMKC